VRRRAGAAGTAARDARFGAGGSAGEAWDLRIGAALGIVVSVEGARADRFAGIEKRFRDYH